MNLITGTEWLVLSPSSTGVQILICHSLSGIRGGRVGGRFSSVFCLFPCHKFHSTAFSTLTRHRPYNGASGLVNRHPCLSHTFIKGLYLIHLIVQYAGQELMIHTRTRTHTHTHKGVLKVSNFWEVVGPTKTREKSLINMGPEMHTFWVLYTCS